MGATVAPAQPVLEINDFTSDMGATDPDPDPTPDMSWLKADLLAYAQERDLAVTEANTKAQIIAAIEEAAG